MKPEAVDVAVFSSAPSSQPVKAANVQFAPLHCQLHLIRNICLTSRDQNSPSSPLKQQDQTAVTLVLVLHVFYLFFFQTALQYF